MTLRHKESRDKIYINQQACAVLYGEGARRLGKSTPSVAVDLSTSFKSLRS